MVGDLAKGFVTELETLLDSRGLRSTWTKRHQWKKIPGWYLEYLYGWKPLADDITNVVDELLFARECGETLHLVLKAKSKSDGLVTLSDADFGTNVATIQHLCRKTQMSSCSYRYDIPSRALDAVEPTGFFGNLWEGTPYSFVLDWALPIGTRLTAIEAQALGIYFVEGSMSSIVRLKPISSKIVPSSAWTVAVDGPVELTTVVQPFFFARTLETPGLMTMRVPFKNPLSLNHMAQGLALLTQFLR
jgi:hypothetical protein